MSDVTDGFSYPSFVAHVTLRFDETMQVAETPAAFGDDGRRDALTGGVRDLTLNVGVIQDAQGNQRIGPVGVSQAQQLATQEATRGLRLQPLVVPNDDNLSKVMQLVPKRASVDMNGVRQAWKFNLTFDFRDMPIDPRLVRAAAVEVHLGTVSPADFADGMNNRRAGGRLTSQLPTRLSGHTPIVAQAGLPNLDTLLMFGTVDTWSVEHGDDGSTVTIEGRDMRGMLLDAHVPLTKMAALDLQKPINEVVQDILATCPADFDLDINVLVDESEWPGGVPSPFSADGVTRVRLPAAKETSSTSTPKAKGKVKSTPAGTSGSGESISYWDLITRYCFLVGAIPYWLGTDIWVRPARNVYQVLGDPTLPAPFAGGQPRRVTTDAGVEKLRVRRLVYGRDIKQLSYERKYGGTVVPIVQVVSIDDTKRGAEKLILAEWPPVNSKASVLKDEKNRIVVPVGGIRDQARLLRIAQDLYEEIGRGEMGGSVQTETVFSFGGSNPDPDLLRMRPTDIVELVVDARALSSRAPLVAELVDHSRRTFAEEVVAVQSRVGDATLARVIVATSRGAVVDNLRYFRVSNVKYDWSADSGIKVAFDYQNYVVARHHAELPAQPAAAVGATSTVTKTRVVKKASARKGGKQGRTTPGKDSAAAQTQVPVPETITSGLQSRNSRLRAHLKALGLSDEQIDQAVARGQAHADDPPSNDTGNLDDLKRTLL